MHPYDEVVLSLENREFCVVVLALLAALALLTSLHNKCRIKINLVHFVEVQYYYTLQIYDVRSIVHTLLD